LQSQLYFLTGVSPFGCQQTDTVFVLVKQPITLTGIPLTTAVCTGNPVILEASGAETYHWEPQTGISHPNAGTVSVSPLVTTLYQLTASDSLGCFTDTSSILITVHPNPRVDAGATQLISAGQSVILRPVYSADALNWQWQPPDGLSCRNCAYPSASPENNTMYNITAYNRYGCSSSDSVLVKISCDKNSIYLPNAFTPGNDGLNDFFYPLSFGKVIITDFKIFNRKGEIIFQRANFNANDRSKGWDGRIKGAHADPGNYVYYVEYICTNKESAGFTGNILLLR
jgi:gliding motility-associated-like protein